MKALASMIFLAWSLAGCDSGGMSHQTPMHGVQLSNNAPPAEPTGDTTGFTAAQKYCSQCHDMPNPSMQATSDWRATIDRMLKHMQTQNKHAPSSEELDLITGYYTSEVE